MKILIPTIPHDIHAIYIHLGLRSLGHEGLLWFSGDFPIQQHHSFHINNNAESWIAGGLDLKFDNEEFDVVWFRRPQTPVTPSFLHPEDKKKALRENIHFYRSFWHLISPNAFWVNKREGSDKASCKTLQLKIAKKVGFKIPTTLISNSPQQIKTFISQFKQVTVYKPLTPMVWREEEHSHLAYTSPVTLDDLPTDAILQCSPGIFQERIDKSFELRITFMGDQAITVKIDSQKHPKGILDWRAIPTQELSINPFVLPNYIYEQCKLFMRELDIVFGCFDFIVSTSGEFYFLEINEQGQFLWIEQLNPDIRLLDAFVNFLIDRSSEFRWDEAKSKLSILPFEDEVRKLNTTMVATHIDEGVIA